MWYCRSKVAHCILLSKLRCVSGCAGGYQSPGSSSHGVRVSVLCLVFCGRPACLTSGDIDPNPINYLIFCLVMLACERQGCLVLHVFRSSASGVQRVLHSGSTLEVFRYLCVVRIMFCVRVKSNRLLSAHRRDLARLSADCWFIRMLGY